jgi:hypothetical protein
MTNNVMVDSGNKIVFIHIPKAGGTTVRSIIYRNVGREQCRYINGYRIQEEVRDIKDLNEETKQALVCIEGHMGYGLHACFPGSSYITLLRDPVSRVESYFSHLKRVPANVRGMFVGIEREARNVSAIPEMFIGEFLEAGMCYEVNNGQTRSLASHDGLPLTIKDKPELDETDLERAKLNLQRFAAVGVVEEFDLFLLLLRARTFISDVMYTIKNRGQAVSQKPALSPEEIEIVRKHNYFDIELHKFIKGWVREKVRETIGDPESHLTKLRSNLLEFEKSHAKDTENRIKAINDKLMKIGFDRKVVIYGAGDHTRDLFKQTRAEELRIDSIVDTYQKDGELCGYRIKNARELNAVAPDVVLISSFSFEEQIYRHLRNTLGYKGEVVRIYESDNTESPPVC